MPASPPARTLPLGASLLLVITLAACSASPPPTTQGIAASPAIAAPPPEAARMAGIGIDELRERGRRALREKRLYAPGGDNAIEFYVAARDRGPGVDADAQSALMELQPYAVIGAEQALDRGDLDEAGRLLRLLAAIDARAPSLPRIVAAIADRRSAQAKHTAVASTAEAGAEPATQALTPAPAPAVVSNASPATSPTQSPAQAPIQPPISRPMAAATSPPAPIIVASPVQAPVAAATPAPKGKLVPVRTPQPNYPEENRRTRAVGHVVAVFTVNADGSVGAVDTESAGTGHTAFERSVAWTLKRWRYQPLDQPREVRMTFAFAP